MTKKQDPERRAILRSDATREEVRKLHQPLTARKLGKIVNKTIQVKRPHSRHDEIERGEDK